MSWTERDKFDPTGERQQGEYEELMGEVIELSTLRSTDYPEKDILVDLRAFLLSGQVDGDDDAFDPDQQPSVNS